MISLTASINTTRWIAEWTKDPKPCFDVVDTALPPRYPKELITIIVEFLRKGDLYGVKALKNGFGKSALTNALKRKLSETPLPKDIDMILQQDIDQVFSNPKTRKIFLSMTISESAAAAFQYVANFFSGQKSKTKKVTHIASVYLKPAVMTGEMAFRLSQIRRGGLYIPDRSEWISTYGNKPESHDRWILFTNFSLGKAISLAELVPNIPRPFHAPQFGDALYCIAAKYACEGICREDYTHCSDGIIVGGSGRFKITPGTDIHYMNSGIALMLKFEHQDPSSVVS